jgi:polar amino acid transport system permease protein
MLWDWSFAFEIAPRLLEGLQLTVIITFASSAISIVLGLVLAVFFRLPWKIVVVPLRTFVEFIRCTPLLVQLFFLFFVLADFGLVLSPLTAGIIGFGLHFATYMAEIYRAGIENVPRGQWDASTALNYSPITTWVHVILPQAIPPMLPATANIVIAMFKETPILMALTVLELMGAATVVANESYRYLEPMTLVGVFFLIISIPTAIAARYLEERVARRDSR